MALSHSFKKTYHNFYEKQRIHSPLLFWMLFLVELFCVFMSVVEILDHKPLGLTSFTNSEYFIFTLFIPTPLFITLMIVRFELVINEDGIFYRWVPFSRNYQMIPWSNVKEMTLINIPGPGYLIANSTRYKEIKYLGGHVGLLFKMTSGRKRLFSTAKAEELNHKLIRIAGNRYIPSDVGQDKDFSD